jgi:hypothetical protein
MPTSKYPVIRGSGSPTALLALAIAFPSGAEAKHTAPNLSQQGAFIGKRAALPTNDERLLQGVVRERL